MISLAKRVNLNALRFALLALLVQHLPIPAPAAEATTAKLIPALGWDSKKQGTFPVSLAEDKSGNIWVGTEGNGLWRYAAKDKSWTQFTTKDGLGDDTVYALAVDQLGRIWAGHLNHGVSVYNGDKWKNYGLVDGPIGDRVFSITMNPKDGDIWIATDLGLSRYSEARQDWDYYSRASGLPSDQIQSVACDKAGNVFAGTQCDGIVYASPADDYKKWTAISQSHELTPKRIGKAIFPFDIIVNGLTPVSIDNDRPVIFAFTTNGISVGGADDPAWLTTDSDSADSGWLKENWVTAFAADKNSFRRWIGFRTLGIEISPLDTGSLHIPEFHADVQKPATVFIRAILPRSDGPVLVAAYDAISGGLLTPDTNPPNNFPKTADTSNPQPVLAPTPGFEPVPLPATAAKPEITDGKALRATVEKLTQKIVAGEAYYLADDWRTEGDWIQRCGTAYVKLCGMAQGDQDYALQPGYSVKVGVGPNHLPNAANAVSFHDDESSNDLRSLYDPTLGHRRDAEENDFSDNLKVYPESYNGPDLWVHVTVPDGEHQLTLYFLNNQAHTASDAKYRDYDVSVVPDYGDDAKTQSAPALAHARVTDFWGGVYKQFLLCGPANFVVRIGRNQSIGTRLQAVFLDRVTGDFVEQPKTLPGFDNAPYALPDQPESYNPTPLTDAAVVLWNKLDDELAVRGLIPLQMPMRIWCYRAAIAGHAPESLLERWRWQISIWSPEERKKFDDAMKAAFQGAR